MRLLLKVTAIIEGITGLALAIVPSSVINMLLGISLTGDSTAVLMARLAGLALVAMALGCWLSRSDTQMYVMLKVITGYNILAMTGLMYIGLVERYSGVGLWSAVLVHLVLLIWCISCLRKYVRKVL